MRRPVAEDYHNVALRDRSRNTEGLLSLGVMIVLGLALALVYLAKRPTEPPNAVFVNAARPEAFAAALDAAPEIAARIAAYRDGRGGFDSCDALLDIPLLKREEAERLASDMTAARVNYPAATETQLIALKVAPAIAARIVAARDAEKSPALFDSPVAPAAAPAIPPAPDLPKLAAILRRLPLLDTRMTRPLLPRFIVRDAGTVFRRFALGSVLLLLAVFLAPPWVRARTSGDSFLIPLCLLLTGLGVVLLFSLKDPLRDGLAYENHLRGLAFGLISLFFTSRLTAAARQRIRNYQYVWVFAAALLVAGLTLFGSGPEGVKLNLLHFQPVEIIKLLLVFFVAGYLAQRGDLIADKSRRDYAPHADASRNPKSKNQNPKLADIGPVAVMFGLALLLFVVVKDLGPGLLLFATFIAVLYLATGRGSFVWAGIGLILVGGCIGYAGHIGVFATRVEMWRSPFDNSRPNGMQLAQSYWAMASGGFEGSGVGMGMPALNPRGGSDLAFSSWAEEGGLAGAWLILTVYAILVWRGLRIAMRAATDFDRTLALGLTALFALQTLLILGGVTGIVPLTGIALPFLSYGNSALVANFLLIGLLRGISAPPPGGVGRPAPRPESLLAIRRFALVYTALLLGGIGVVRLGTLQLLRADEIAVRPVRTPDADGIARPHQNPRLLALERLIPRGDIYDRNGKILATSRPEEIAALVSDPAEVRRLQTSRRRYYPFGAACAHLVGYLDPGVGGPFGLEKGYDAELRGFAHHADLLPDYRNRNLPGYDARRGRDLHLTIDAAMQRDIQALLWKSVSSLKDTRTGQPKDRAAFVLMEPKTGDVIVAATTPTFDPNTLTPLQVRQWLTAPDANLEARFVNRAVSGWYPPGSTLKIATAAAALDTLPNALNFAALCNQTAPELRWQARGKTYVRRNTRDDTGDPAFGTLTLAPAFRVSSNIYFANLAIEINASRFRQELAQKFHFRRVPSADSFDADLPDIGYGQGRMLASPLEMARLAAAVGNGGKMPQARFLTSLTDPAKREKKRVSDPVSLGQAMTPKSAQTVRDMMRGVVENGTAAGVFNTLAVPVAGKTGTAQNGQGDGQPHSWFVGFAPYGPDGAAAPRYAFACVVENGGYGKRVAAVICRDALTKLFPPGTR